MESIYTSQPYIYAFIVYRVIVYVKSFDITRLGYTYTHIVYIPRATYIGYPYIYHAGTLILFNPFQKR